MNKSTIYTVIGATVAGAAVIAGAALPAFALATGVGARINAEASATTSVGAANAGVGVGVNVGASTTLSGRIITNITNRADQEITRRLAALNALAARVNAMVRLSDSQKASLSASIQSQISALNTLQSKIASDAQAESTSSLKIDVQSIVKSYRIFALVLPQGAIQAASDRILSVSNIMADLSAKFSARISEAQSAGNNVSASETLLADMNAKISDANTKVQAASSEVASLVPDNGNQTVMASNTAALKDARAKIVAAQQDLVAARLDAKNIVKALAGFKVSASASTTVSSTASTSAQ